MKAKKITPFLWFDDNAEEAIEFYTSVFEDSKIHAMSRWPAGGPVPEGVLMSATIELQGQEIMVMNAGPHFKFNEAISLFVSCKGQEEVDYFWERLTADGGQESKCGWLKDKYGLSWQIIPDALGEAFSNPDPKKAQRAAQAMCSMTKIIVADLLEAQK